jgi:hypothetical protein
MLAGERSAAVALTSLAPRWRQEIAKSDSMVTYLACGEGLAQNIQKYTMDGIHPTAAGAAQRLCGLRGTLAA